MKKFKDGDYIAIDNPNNPIRHIFNVRESGSHLNWDQAPLNSNEVTSDTGHSYSLKDCHHVSRERLLEAGVKLDEVINNYQIY